MTFEDDAGIQLATIINNLSDCKQTPNIEKEALQKLIDSEADHPISRAGIRRIQSAVRDQSEHNGWYFKGASASALAGTELLSTQTEDRFQFTWSQGLRMKDPSLTVNDAVLMASAAVSALQDPLLFTAARVTNSSIPLHRHGTPIWLADPQSSKKDAFSHINFFPARVGLAPKPGKYLLFRVTVSSCFQPRFADSGAYPYWRASGRTLPIEQCPASLDGFTEVISDGVTVAAVQSPLQSFSRTI